MRRLICILFRCHRPIWMKRPFYAIDDEDRVYAIRLCRNCGVLYWDDATAHEIALLEARELRLTERVVEEDGHGD